MISINDEIDATLQFLEKSLQETNNHIESYQKEILHSEITKKNIDRYIKRQRRINSLKSPFRKARGVLQGILGESIEEIQDEELIDTSSLDEEHEVAKSILDDHTYTECIEFFKQVQKNNLNRVNKKWVKSKP